MSLGEMSVGLLRRAALDSLLGGRGELATEELVSLRSRARHGLMQIHLAPTILGLALVLPLGEVRGLLLKLTYRRQRSKKQRGRWGR